MGNIRQCLTELSAHDTIMAGYYSLTFLFLLNYMPPPTPYKYDMVV